MHTLLQRQEPCSADSVFREWSFVQRDFWIRTQTRRETRSRLRCATTSAAAPDIKKIMDAVELAAKIKREGKGIPKKEFTWKLGERVHRVDAREKTLGYGEYVDDMEVEGLLHASAVRSKYPRARVLSIDTEKAKAVPGIVDIFTAADIPGDVKVGHLVQDWDTMIPVGSITHYLGDAIALVVGENLDVVEKAKKLVKVEYEELPFVSSPYEAMKEDAPQVHGSGNLLAHKHVSRGNAKEAIANAKYVYTEEFHTPGRNMHFWSRNVRLPCRMRTAY